VRAADRLDLRERAQPGEQTREVFLRLRVLEPEEDVVDQLGI